MGFFKRNLIAGVVLWLPIIACFFILQFILKLLNHLFLFLPATYQPDALLGIHLPGLNLLLLVLILFFSGIFATNYIGKHLVLFGERILSHIPLVRGIYHAVKESLQVILSPNAQSFRRVVLVEYPRKDSWSVAFVTNPASLKTHQNDNKKNVMLFVPTTPNPTSGYLIIVPEKDVVALDMPVDEALKWVVSMGTLAANVKFTDNKQ
jgi:uncharacterized membrane protein